MKTSVEVSHLQIQLRIVFLTYVVGTQKNRLNQTLWGPNTCLTVRKEDNECNNLKLEKYSKTVYSGHSKRRPKIGFQDRWSLNAAQKYCRMLQGEHSAILLTFIKLSLKCLFCLFYSGHLRQVLLYTYLNLYKYPQHMFLLTDKKKVQILFIIMSWSMHKCTWIYLLGFYIHINSYHKQWQSQAFLPFDPFLLVWAMP